MEVKVKIQQRKAISTYNLKEYCYFAKKDDFIEVTEWSNGEGIDIAVEARGTRFVSLTLGEFDAIKKLVKKLYKNERDNIPKDNK